MKRLITFLDEGSGTQLVLPVTPAGYEWARQAAIQVVTVDQLGDLNFFGGVHPARPRLSLPVPRGVHRPVELCGAAGAVD